MFSTDKEINVTPTFVIKTVDTIDAGTLVVASKNKKVFRIFDFVRE